MEIIHSWAEVVHPTRQINLSNGIEKTNTHGEALETIQSFMSKQCINIINCLLQCCGQVWNLVTQQTQNFLSAKFDAKQWLRKSTEFQVYKWATLGMCLGSDDVPFDDQTSIDTALWAPVTAQTFYITLILVWGIIFLQKKKKLIPFWFSFVFN